MRLNMFKRFSSIFYTVSFSAALLAGCGGGSGGTAVPISTNAAFDSGELSAGGFEAGTEIWTSNHETSITVIDDAGNQVYSVNNETVAANSYDVNLEQVTAITQGKSYTLDFIARTDTSRTIIVGIGLNEDPWTNVSQEITLDADWNDFSLTFDAATFGNDNSRVFFDFGADSGLVLLDNIILEEVENVTVVTPPASSDVELPVTFEDSNATYAFTDFDGGSVVVIDNPQTTGNTSAKVGQMVKDGGQAWGGSKLVLDAPIDFTSGEIFTMNVWSSRAVPVLFKLEGASANAEVTANHGGSGWEALSFDLSGNTAGLGETTDVVLIFDNGTVGDATTTPGDWTFYFDDINQTVADVAPPSEESQIDLPVTFEVSDVDYTVTDFGGTTSSLVADPSDASNMVISTVKAGDAELWAGTTIGNDVADVDGDGGLASVIPFTATATTISVRVYSPDAGAVVRFKVERSDDAGVTAETETLTTVANEWETLVFDLNMVATGTAAFDSAAGYDKASIFFNFGTDGATAGEKTYLWDDVTFGGEITVTPPPVVTVALPLDFELSADSYTRDQFGDAVFEIAADPENAANNALKMTRPAGTPWWSGGFDDLETPVDATTGTFSMDLYSTIALAYVELKLEGADAANNTIMVATHGGTGWETLVFDTSTGTVNGSPTAATRVVYTPRVTNSDPNPSVDEVYYIDNIMVAGAVTPPLAGTVALPLDFELSADSYTRDQFGDAVFEIAADPENAANNALKMTRPAGTPWWSGGFDDLENPVDASTGTFSMDLHSTTPLAYVELKLEGVDAANNTIMVATHGGTGWETLVFDTSTGTVNGSPTAATRVVYTPRVTNSDPNPSVDEVYYIDNIKVGGTATPPAVSASDFDFETATTSWTVFENDDNPALEVIANPVSGGINTSATVAKFTARQTGQPWAGTETAHGAVGPFTLSSAESTVKIMVYKTVISDVGIKLVTTSGGALGELKVANTVVNQWEELTFDFTGYIGNAIYAAEQVDQIVVFPDFDLAGRTTDTISYFDNISLGQ